VVVFRDLRGGKGDTTRAAITERQETLEFLKGIDVETDDMGENKTPHVLANAGRKDGKSAQAESQRAATRLDRLMLARGRGAGINAGENRRRTRKLTARRCPYGRGRAREGPRSLRKGEGGGGPEAIRREIQTCICSS